MTELAMACAANPAIFLTIMQGYLARSLLVECDEGIAIEGDDDAHFARSGEDAAALTMAPTKIANRKCFMIDFPIKVNKKGVVKQKNRKIIRLLA